jgi:hypothetical protein
MTEEKLKEFLLECYKVWCVRRALLTAIGKLLDDEIEDELDSDPHFAAVFRGLLNGDDFSLIEDCAQLNCTVEEYIGLK